MISINLSDETCLTVGWIPFTCLYVLNEAVHLAYLKRTRNKYKFEEDLLNYDVRAKQEDFYKFYNQIIEDVNGIDCGLTLFAGRRKKKIISALEKKVNTFKSLSKEDFLQSREKFLKECVA